MDILGGVIVSAILLAGVYFIVSLGLNIIFGVLDIVNFAHGALVIIGAYVTYFLTSQLGISAWAAIPLDGIALAIFGSLLYLCYLRFTVDEPLVRMFGLVGLASVATSALTGIAGSGFRTITATSGSMMIFGLSVPNSQLISFGVAVVAGAITFAWLRLTTSGKAVRAAVDDRVALRLTGVDDRKISLLAFAVGSALAGIGGGVIATYLTFGPDSGPSFAVIAFSVVILGGLGDLVAAGIAALLIALVYTLTSVYSTSSMADVYIFLLVLIGLLLRPTGILGRGRS
jgi:branched-chain amino acid transport system permease protein